MYTPRLQYTLIIFVAHPTVSRGSRSIIDLTSLACLCVERCGG